MLRVAFLLITFINDVADVGLTRSQDLFFLFAYLLFLAFSLFVFLFSVLVSECFWIAVEEPELTGHKN